jgi:hypothetical protein
MRLALRIPQSESEALPLVLSLAHSAPMFRTETEGLTSAYTAIFPDLSLSFDLVERLVEAAAELPDAQVSNDDRPVESLAKFLSVLRCCRESLTELDPRFIARVKSRGSAMWVAARIAPASPITSSPVCAACKLFGRSTPHPFVFNRRRLRYKPKWSGARISECCEGRGENVECFL